MNYFVQHGRPSTFEVQVQTVEFLSKDLKFVSRLFDRTVCVFLIDLTISDEIMLIYIEISVYCKENTMCDFCKSQHQPAIHCNLLYSCVNKFIEKSSARHFS